MARKKPVRPYHHGDLRRTLLDAALAIAGKAGPGALSLRELARKAGVSHAAPYRHFASREALVLALAIEGFRGLGEEMQRCAGDEGNPILRFRALGVAYVSYAVSHPGHFRIMFSSELHQGEEDPELAEAGAPTLEALVDTIAEGQRAGQIRDGNPRELAVPAWSMVHGLAVLLVDQQLRALVDVVYAETLAHAVIDVTVRGLSPSPSPSAASSPASSSSRASRRRRSSS